VDLATREPLPQETGPEQSPSPPSAPGAPAGLLRWVGYWLANLTVGLIPLILLGIVAGILLYSSGYQGPSMPWRFENFGWSFWSFDYDFNPSTPSASTWGIGVYVVGTAITAGLALLFATALSLALAISITVYLPAVPRRVLTVLTNLLAGIPSVVFGLWGFVILAPYFGYTLEPTLRAVIGWLPGFGGPASAIGPWGLLLAIFILTIMIVPLTTALMRESLQSVPRDMVEAGLALGATRWEVVRRVRLRVARRGITTSILLGFARALGESLAVAMVIGAVPKLPTSLYSTSTTVASFIFYQLDSAFTYPDLLRLLVEYALILLIIALVVNLIAQRLTRIELATATTVGGTE
jgi:phosphate transport system permease protein